MVPRPVTAICHLSNVIGAELPLRPRHISVAVRVGLILRLDVHVAVSGVRPQPARKTMRELHVGAPSVLVIKVRVAIPAQPDPIVGQPPKKAHLQRRILIKGMTRPQLPSMTVLRPKMAVSPARTVDLHHPRRDENSLKFRYTFVLSVGVYPKE